MTNTNTSFDNALANLTRKSRKNNGGQSMKNNNSMFVSYQIGLGFASEGLKTTKNNHLTRTMYNGAAIQAANGSNAGNWFIGFDVVSKDRGLAPVYGVKADGTRVQLNAMTFWADFTQSEDNIPVTRFEFNLDESIDTDNITDAKSLFITVACGDLHKAFYRKKDERAYSYKRLGKVKKISYGITAAAKVSVDEDFVIGSSCVPGTVVADAFKNAYADKDLDNSSDAVATYKAANNNDSITKSQYRRPQRKAAHAAKKEAAKTVTAAELFAPKAPAKVEAPKADANAEVMQQMLAQMQQMTASVNELREEIKELKAENAALRAENAALKAVPADLEEVVAEPTPQVQAVEASAEEVASKEATFDESAHQGSEEDLADVLDDDMFDDKLEDADDGDFIDIYGEDKEEEVDANAVFGFSAAANNGADEEDSEDCI